MAVNTTDKDSLHTVQNAQVCQTLRHAQGDLHIVFLTQTVLVNELFHAVSHIVDHSGLLRRKGRIVPFMCAGCPDRSHHQLPHNCRNTRQQIAELCRHQADHDVQNTIGCHSAKDLAVHQLRDPLHGHPERIVDFTQCNVQDKKQPQYRKMTLPCQVGIGLVRIVQEPAGRKRQFNHQNIQYLHDPQHHIMLKL